MKIKQEYFNCFKEKTINSNLKFYLGKEKNHPLVRETRLSILKKESEGKKTIHLGCCDHLELINQKRTEGNWLHDILTTSSETCIGLDICQEGVEHAHHIGVSNIMLCDITKNVPKEISDNSLWDMIIAGEILEHVDNPVLFLNAIHNQLKNYVKEIIITVPNAWRWSNIRNISNGIEFINSDHRYWFTPYTLVKICLESNFIPKKFYYVENQTVALKEKLRYPVRNYLIKKFPAFRDTIIFKASFL